MKEGEGVSNSNGKLTLYNIVLADHAEPCSAPVTRTRQHQTGEKQT